MRLKLQILLATLLLSRCVPAQTPEQVNAYINTYKYLAIAEMQRSGVPASIILAQGIHETSAGTSDLVIASNNHFGIKCKAGWTGQTVYHDDDAKGECFRSYAIAADSYRDHSDYLRQTPRYAFLFKLSPEDYEGWAYGLKKAGYATNIKYSQILIKLIADYDLEKYTLVAMGKLPADQPSEGTLAGEMMRPSLPGFTDSSTQKVVSTATYPEGAFAINAAKCIYVKAGVSLLSLSNQYEIPLSHLLEFNDMRQEDILSNDQLIFLQRKRKTGFTAFHIVQPGESMYSICQTEGIRYESLLEFNHLKPGEEPAAGEKIYLQTITGNKPALKNSASIKTTIPSS
ncbi:MAG TPA: glucosaminidase domain-containing protein [Puia sp.]|jgi:LysM repeat protein